MNISAREEAAEIKHEFWSGTIIDMAGSTAEHSAISTNLTTELSIRLKVKSCKAYNSVLRVRIDDIGHYCYPDATVACGPLEYAQPNRRTTITNPTVIIEVASPFTETRDAGEKFDDYRQILSLQEYVLVSQDRARVQSFYRQSDGVWAFGPSYVAMNQAVKFRSLGCEIPLNEIYLGVEFPSAPVRAPEAFK